MGGRTQVWIKCKVMALLGVLGRGIEDEDEDEDGGGDDGRG